MPSFRIVLPTAAVLMTLVSGCGGNDTGAAAPSPEASSSSSTAPSTPALPSPSPTSSASADAAKAKTFCDSVDLAAVGKVAGGKVFKTDDPNGGCSFAQDDQNAATIGFTLVVDGVTNGGLDSARRGTVGVVTGTLSEVPAAGAGAFVVVGSIRDQTNQAQGAVLNGNDVVLVTVIQRSNLKAKKVLAVASGALEIAARSGPGASGA